MRISYRNMSETCDLEIESESRKFATIDCKYCEHVLGVHLIMAGYQDSKINCGMWFPFSKIIAKQGELIEKIENIDL